ncbi:MAG: SDR family oxidoreductase [Chloroflexi bacterium]|nr:SDR family oxidoreductase [Chloroflexota bacterium]
MDLRGMVATVTGGGTGLGEGIALALAKEGAKIVVAGRRPEPLNSVVAKIKQGGRTALAIPTDVTREDQIKRLVGETLKAFGTVHVLVNNAGGGTGGRFLIKDMPNEGWDRVVNTNLRGALLLIREVLPAMIEQREGAVVNICSNIVFSAKSHPGSSAYCAAKLGLWGVTRVLANEVHEYGIRVHAVMPGNFKTPIWGDRRTAEELDKMALPEDLGEAVRWLVTQPPRVNIEDLTVMPFFDESWRN